MRNKQDITVNTNTSQWNFSNCRSFEIDVSSVFSHHQKKGWMNPSVGPNMVMFFPQTLPAWHNRKTLNDGTFSSIAMYIFIITINRSTILCPTWCKLLHSTSTTPTPGTWKLWQWKMETSWFFQVCFLVACKPQSQPWNDMNHKSYWLVQVPGSQWLMKLSLYIWAVLSLLCSKFLKLSKILVTAHVVLWHSVDCDWMHQNARHFAFRTLHSSLLCFAFLMFGSPK